MSISINGKFEGSDEDKKIHDKIAVRGLSGLKNMGNTCYLNSALQCLFSTSSLRSYFIDKKFMPHLRYNVIKKLATQSRNDKKLSENDDVSINESDITKTTVTTLTYNFYELMKALWSSNWVVTPREFKEALCNQNELFRGYNQHDSQEAMHFILDTIHEELKRSGKVRHKDIPNSVLEFKKISDPLLERINKLEEIEQQFKRLDVVTQKVQDMIGNSNPFHKINPSQINAFCLEKKQLKEKLGKINKAKVIEDKITLLKEYSVLAKSNFGEFMIYSYLRYMDVFIGKSYSIVRDIFTGLMYTEIICSGCQHLSVHFEGYDLLQVAIPETSGTVTLMSCLENYISKELLDGKNKYNCPECQGYTVASKKISIWSFPEVLIVQLKRFSSDPRNPTIMQKNNTFVDFPFENLELKSLCSSHNTYTNHVPTYELYAVVQQHGSLLFGHYTAYCKNAVNKEWYYFNDARVEFVKPGTRQNDIVHRDAYILFYKRQYKALDDDDDK